MWGVRGVQFATESTVNEPADLPRVDVDLVVVPVGDVERDLLGCVIWVAGVGVGPVEVGQRLTASDTPFDEVDLPEGPFALVLRPQHGDQLHPIRRGGLEFDLPGAVAGSVVETGPCRAQQRVVQSLLVAGPELAVELIGGTIQAQRQRKGATIGKQLRHIGAVASQSSVLGALHAPASVGAVRQQAGMWRLEIHYWPLSVHRVRFPCDFRELSVYGRCC